MVGYDVVINAAGHVAQASSFTQLVQTVINSTTTSLGESGRLWQLGGAAILDVPGTQVMGVDLSRVPKVYEAHRTDLAALRKSPLDWSMLCPGPMIAAQTASQPRICGCPSTNGQSRDLPTLIFFPHLPWHLHLSEQYQR
jgi:putative NADH-flavin reductase